MADSVLRTSPTAAFMPKNVDPRSLLTFPAPPREPALLPHRQHVELPRVLIAGKDEHLAHSLKQSIHLQCSAIQTEWNPHSACRRLASEDWDILLLDLSSEDFSSLEILHFLRGSNSPTTCIVIAASLEVEPIASAIDLGIQGLLIKPLNAARLRFALDRAFVSTQKERQRAAHIERLKSDVQILRQDRALIIEELDTLQQSVMEALLAALAIREVDSVLHAFRVQAYVSYFARAAGYPEVLQPHLEHAALLHDIGKIGLSDNLLFRPGVLTQAERDRMRPHTILGEQILERIDFLRPAAQIVRHHHEWFDGSGHPDGLQGERIPLGARLFAIMDALDAFTTNRPYRAAQSFELAQCEIVRCAGTHFDPQLAECFRRIPTGTWRGLRKEIEERHRKCGLHLIDSDFSL